MEKVIVALKKPFRTKKQRRRDRLNKATNRIRKAFYQGALSIISSKYIVLMYSKVHLALQSLGRRWRGWL